MQIKTESDIYFFFLKSQIKNNLLRSQTTCKTKRLLNSPQHFYQLQTFQRGNFALVTSTYLSYRYNFCCNRGLKYENLIMRINSSVKHKGYFSLYKVLTKMLLRFEKSYLSESLWRYCRLKPAFACSRRWRHRMWIILVVRKQTSLT